MRRTSGSFLLAAGVVAAGALVVAWHNHRATAQAEVMLADLAQQRAAMVASMATTEHNRSTTIEPAKPEQAKSPAPATSGAAKSDPAAESLTSYYERWRQDPELQVLRLDVDRARAATRYGPLFRSLGLSPEQRARFQENVIRRDEEKSDVEAAIGPGEPSESEEAAMKLRAQIDQRYETAQRDVLGDAGLQAMLDYEQTLWIREMVATMAGAAVLAGAPLNPQQAEQLTQVMIADSNDTPKERRDSEGLLNWQRIDARAQGVLTEAQMNLFKRIEPGLNGRFQMRLDQALSAAHNADREQAARVKAADSKR